MQLISMSNIPESCLLLNGKFMELPEFHFLFMVHILHSKELGGKTVRLANECFYAVFFCLIRSFVINDSAW